MDLKYSVANVEGDYDLAHLEHEAKLVGRLGDVTMGPIPDKQRLARNPGHGDSYSYE